MKDKLGGKIMIEFAILRPKTFSYLTDNSDANKKAKYQFFIIKRGGAGLKHCNDSKALLNAQMI